MGLAGVHEKGFTGLHHEHQLPTATEMPLSGRRISIFREVTRWKRVHLRVDEAGCVRFTVGKTGPERGYKLLRSTWPGKLGCRLG